MNRHLKDLLIENFVFSKNIYEYQKMTKFYQKNIFF